MLPLLPVQPPDFIIDHMRQLPEWILAESRLPSMLPLLPVQPPGFTLDHIPQLPERIQAEFR